MGTKHLLFQLILIYVGSFYAWEYRKEVSVPVVVKKAVGEKDALHDLTLELMVFNKRVVLDLKRNRNHHVPTIPVRLFDDDGKDYLEQYSPDACYYHGRLRDDPWSFAAFSTCSGLRGSFEDESGHYVVQPMDDDKVEVTKVDANDPSMPINFVQKQDALHATVKDYEEEDKPHSELHSHINKRSLAELKNDLVDVQPQYMKYPHVNRTRYLEFFAVVDSFIYRNNGNKTTFILQRVVDTINELDRQYSAINVRIILVGVEIWTDGEKIPRSKSSHADLSQFQDYCNKNLQTKFNYDVAHFLSYRGWLSSIIGLGAYAAICRWNRYGIDYFDPKLANNFWLMAHELGHNFGMSHDKIHCKCLAKTGGCNLGAGGKCRYCGFSNCSMEEYSRNAFRCLNNLPKVTFKAACGNGIIDAGEECDCGTEEHCRQKDPCCVPHQCRLKLGYQCSDFANPGCCEKCMFKEHGTLCRKSSGPCDFPEYCTGQEATCPTDTYAKDATPCSTKAHATTAYWSYHIVDFINFEPEIEAKFVRILPQQVSRYWKKHCLRMELLGCALNQGTVATPTSISTRDLGAAPSLCVIPDHKGCDPFKGGKLIYHRAELGNCSAPAFQFIHDADGTLRHQCSKQLVCPSADNSRLMINSSCDKDNAKFRRSPEGLLFHVKTSKCIIASRNRPAEGGELLLSKWCNIDQYRVLDFQATDCLLPLGLETGKIPNESFSASSFDQGGDPKMPYYARLWNKQYYCSATSSSGEFLQVELPEVTKLGGLKIQTVSHFFYLDYSTDGVHWHSYTGKSNDKDANSFCFNGECIAPLTDQCRFLWEKGATKAAPACWNTLNTDGKGFGTCSPFKNQSCAANDVYCGQIQCKSYRTKPDIVDFGSRYQVAQVLNETCSAAALKFEDSDSVGVGMVQDGTKCGEGKLCLKQKCLPIKEVKAKACLYSEGKECGGPGRGACLNNGQCYCFKGYDALSGCGSLAQPVDGGIGSWNKWSDCTKLCGRGTQYRVRFCDTPYPKHGGKPCTGNLQESRDCNKKDCPIPRSCRELQKLKNEEGKPFPSGVYFIKPADTLVKTFCDMQTSGGGWTLLVSARTNTWTAENVLLRNEDNPRLTRDYSILKHADSIKSSYLIEAEKFEYRIDAQKLGHSGGVWRVPRHYSFVSTSGAQTSIELLEKYGNWEYTYNGLKARMPYIYKQMITTSYSPESNPYGSITDNRTAAYPAYWIPSEVRPEHIWYWLREGERKEPKSCKEIKLRGLNGDPYPSGEYLLAMTEKDDIRTFCDMTRYGGGWTLVLTAASGKGWTRGNVEKRNSDMPSMTQDFSILEYANRMKGSDISDNSFQYLIEADGPSQYGGVFGADSSINFTTCTPKSAKPYLLKKFGQWNETTANLANRIPYITQKNGIYFTTSSTEADDTEGSLVYLTSSAGIYLKGIKEQPTVIRMWLREGGRRQSCNDIKLHAQQRGKANFRDGVYMIREKDPNMIPVYCDMTSSESGWTLLVTSRHNNWTAAQVLSRNEDFPSISDDYSIMRWADNIKAAGRGDTFQYRIEASKRFHHGGVFQAPSIYTLLARNNSQTKVSLVTKYGGWTLNAYFGLKTRVPWLSDPKLKTVLLTTGGNLAYNRWASIVSTSTRFSPAPYIAGAYQPGIIWYWVNEDDCGTDRKPVDGHYGEWSLWSPCLAVCEKGKVSRQRSCNAPRPGCGGKGCDPLEADHETKECDGFCQATEIRTDDSRFCLVPQTGGCNVTDGTRVHWREGKAFCDSPEAKFVFDTVTGTIIHQCSGNRMCPKDMKLKWNSPIVLSSTCPEQMTLEKQFQRTPYGHLNIGGWCVHPASQISDKQVIQLASSCAEETRLIMRFPKQAQGPVTVGIFKQPNGTGNDVEKLTGDIRYPNNPTLSGFIDNFDLPRDLGNNYGAVLRSFFVAPISGRYTFYISCDDFCSFAISENASPEKAKVILRLESWVPRYNWNRRSGDQESEEVSLEKGKYYYIQGNLVEIGGGDHLAVGVKLPTGQLVRPISNHYLSAKVTKTHA